MDYRDPSERRRLPGARESWPARRQPGGVTAGARGAGKPGPGHPSGQAPVELDGGHAHGGNRCHGGLFRPGQREHVARCRHGDPFAAGGSQLASALRYRAGSHLGRLRCQHPDPGADLRSGDD